MNTIHDYFLKAHPECSNKKLYSTLHKTRVHHKLMIDRLLINYTHKRYNKTFQLLGMIERIVKRISENDIKRDLYIQKILKIKVTYHEHY